MAANPNLIKPTSVIELVSKTPIYNGIIKPDDIPFDQKLNYHILLSTLLIILKNYIISITSKKPTLCLKCAI